MDLKEIPFITDDLDKVWSHSPNKLTSTVVGHCIY